MAKKQDIWSSWKTESASVLKPINKQLKSKKFYTKGDKDLVQELERYLTLPIAIPKKLDSSNRKNIRALQSSIAELDARQTRVAAIQFTTAKILQLLNRLETILRNDLILHNVLNDHATGPKQKIVVSKACPKLQEALSVWEGMEKLVSIVSNRLADSKKACQLQIKLDENARWADKIAP